MELEVELQHVSVGCNRTPHCVDWNADGLLAYGADKSIALATDCCTGSGLGRVVSTLHGHKDRVNCVRWIRARAHAGTAVKEPWELVSGSVDSCVIVWRQKRAEKLMPQFAPSQVLSSHTGPVTCLAATYPPPDLTTTDPPPDLTTDPPPDLTTIDPPPDLTTTDPPPDLTATYPPPDLTATDPPPDLTTTDPPPDLTATDPPPDLTATADRGRDPPTIHTLIASGSSDSSVIIWERKAGEDQFAPMQTISFGRGFVLGMDFSVLPGTAEPVFVCGGDDTRVSFFVRRGGQFVRAQSLTGHEDWVRDVQFAEEDGRDLLLASCSQDAYIRLWRIAAHPHPSTTCDGVEGVDGDLKLTGNIISIPIGQEAERHFSIILESVLIGHEDWVYSIQWQPPDKDSYTQPLILLSASMDKTMIVWKPDPATGVWIEQVRVGDVGGSTLGLYGGVFSPRGDFILAHGYQGAFHLWKKTEMDQSGGLELWQPIPTLSGHFGPVQDLSWEPGGGRFLLSVSSDQTARLHAPWKRGEHVTWHEMARPQIHGYDMQCVAMTTSLQYISGADEKVLRVFEAPRNFTGNLSRIAKLDLKQTLENPPLGASVPSLGLSNKAVFCAAKVQPEEGEGSVTRNPFANHLPAFIPVDLEEPPLEEHLLQSTLWPETQKLYGHGYEIFCVASSADGRYVASACKASKPEHASIRVWSAVTWRQVALLTHHTLTVTQLAFSHSGSYLLAVSRDRGWSLWKHTSNEGAPPFSLVATTDKSLRSHTRIIWSCSWACDDSCFATASRDKKVYLWNQHASGGGAEGEARDCGEGWRVVPTPLECSHAVTAVDFAPSPSPDGRHILAVGLECGEIMLHSCHLAPPYWTSSVAISPAFCHTSAVKRLQWKPLSQEREEDLQSERPFPTEHTLASCGQDLAVRLFTVKWCAA